jgi:6-phosphogluconolactonase
MGKEIRIYPNLDTLSQAAADLLIELAKKSISDKGRFSVALSGGSTPKPLYEALASTDRQEKLEWEKIHLFWGDERCVPPDHPDSNYKMVRESLLQNISIPEKNIHRVPAELDPRMAAFSYEEALRNLFNGPLPVFDLVFLGMGRDGHTASLFPHSAGLNEEARWFIANYAPERGTWRLTLTKNAINAAKTIVVLVAGGAKADMLFDVLEGEYQPFEKPIQLIMPVDGRMIWFVDQAAAENLSDQG